MKALTIHQPFASLIMAGAKPFEFRSRRAPSALIGQRIVIHASARPMRPQDAAALFLSVRDQALGSIVAATLDGDKALPVLSRAWQPNGEPLPTSVGLGTVVIGAPRPVAEIAPDHGIPFSDEEAELWAWPMLDIDRWALPVPKSGAQGFWRWPGGCLDCRGSGYTDYAGFGMDPCNHTIDAAARAVAR